MKNSLTADQDVAPTAEKFFDQVSGCLFDTLEEAIRQSVDSVSEELLFEIRSDNGNSTKSGAELLANKQQILWTMERLKAAYSGKFITKYKKA